MQAFAKELKAPQELKLPKEHTIKKDGVILFKGRILGSDHPDPVKLNMLPYNLLCSCCAPPLTPGVHCHEVLPQQGRVAQRHQDCVPPGFLQHQRV